MRKSDHVIEGSKMRTTLITCLALSVTALAGCGTLEKKAALINPGDDKAAVLAVMGTPEDRQFRGGEQEAWQYCTTGVVGAHDYRIVWFEQGKVAGITSYKSETSGMSCGSRFTAIKWEDAPASPMIRNR